MELKAYRQEGKHLTILLVNDITFYAVYCSIIFFILI